MWGSSNVGDLICLLLPKADEKIKNAHSLLYHIFIKFVINGVHLCMIMGYGYGTSILMNTHHEADIGPPVLKEFRC